MSDALERVKDYLGSGGLFNPELMEHEKVRDLIMDCREEIQKRDAEIENLVLTNKIIGNDKECFRLEIKRQKGEIERLKGLLEKAKPYMMDHYVMYGEINETLEQWLKQYEELKR